MWLLQVLLGQGLKTLSLSTRSWNWYFVYIHFYIQQWHKSLWTQIFSSGTLNINNIMMREFLPLSNVMTSIGEKYNDAFAPRQTQVRNQSHSGTHHCTPSTAAAIDAEASSRVLFFWYVLKASRMSPSSHSSKSSNPSPHSRPALTCSQGRKTLFLGSSYNDMEKQHTAMQ